MAHGVLPSSFLAHHHCAPFFLPSSSLFPPPPPAPPSSLSSPPIRGAFSRQNGPQTISFCSLPNPHSRLCRTWRRLCAKASRIFAPTAAVSSPSESYGDRLKDCVIVGASVCLLTLGLRAELGFAIESGLNVSFDPLHDSCLIVTPVSDSLEASPNHLDAPPCHAHGVPAVDEMHSVGHGSKRLVTSISNVFPASFVDSIQGVLRSANPKDYPAKSSAIGMGNHRERGSLGLVFPNSKEYSAEISVSGMGNRRETSSHGFDFLNPKHRLARISVISTGNLRKRDSRGLVFPNPKRHPEEISLESADKCQGRGSHDLVLLGDSPLKGACQGSAEAAENEMDYVVPPQAVTNESVVEEAWQVVNDVFLDARHHSWSQGEWAKVKEKIFKRPIHSKMAAYAAIRNMLSTLDDPFTRFLTPAEFTKMSKYDITGIGINIGEATDENGTNHLKVLGIVLGSPAQLAGIREGDEVLSVEGKSVIGRTAFETSSLIQGPKGRPVSIEIRHGPCGQSRKLVIERQQDVKTPVYYRLESSKEPGELTGYIRLKEFNALAKRDLVIAMKRLRDAGASSFLLDLRDNLGGLVQAGIEIARLFLEDGETVVYTVGQEAGSAKNIVATGGPLTRAPLTILVNDQTASASEIVAAALHDNCRAILVGHKTFGKGLIQSVYELSDGSGIVLTVGKYVTPNQNDIDRNGIEPDFTRMPRLSEASEKLRKCHTSKHSDKSHLPDLSLSKISSTLSGHATFATCNPHTIS